MLWCIIHSNDKGSHVWLEEYGASAIGAPSPPQCLDFLARRRRDRPVLQIAPAAARKLPKDMIGRVLEGAEGERLMNNLAAKKKLKGRLPSPQLDARSAHTRKRHFGSPKKSPGGRGWEGLP